MSVETLCQSPTRLEVTWLPAQVTHAESSRAFFYSDSVPHLLQEFVSSRSAVKMKFQPTSEELKTSISHLKDPPSDLNAHDLHVSCSDWSEAHLTALRVVVLDNVDHSSLYPSKYWPSESNEGLSYIMAVIWS